MEFRHCQRRRSRSAPRRLRRNDSRMNLVTPLLDKAGPHLAIGLISGTSHDGISAAVVEVDPRRTPPLRVLARKTFPYRSALRERLLRASAGDGVGTSEIAQLNF